MIRSIRNGVLLVVGRDAVCLRRYREKSLIFSGVQVLWEVIEN
jgi:hypothetical protein